MPRGDGGIAWSIAPTDTPTGRLAVYGLLAGAAGFVTLAVALLTVAAVVVAVTGGSTALAVLVVLTLLGGPVSLLYLAPRLFEADNRPGLPGALGRIDWRDLDAPAVAASVTGAAIVVGLLFLQRPLFAFVAVGATLVAGTVAVHLTAPDGRVDPAAGTLTVYGTTHDLDDLTALHTYPFGDLVLVRARFVPKPGGRDAPWLVTVPRSAFDRVEPTLQRGLAADADPPATQRPGERIAFATFGLAALAVAAAVAYFAVDRSTDAGDILFAIAGVAAVFGAYMLYSAGKRTT